MLGNTKFAWRQITNDKMLMYKDYVTRWRDENPSAGYEKEDANNFWNHLKNEGELDTENQVADFKAWVEKERQRNKTERDK